MAGEKPYQSDVKEVHPNTHAREAIDRLGVPTPKLVAHYNLRHFSLLQSVSWLFLFVAELVWLTVNVSLRQL